MLMGWIYLAGFSAFPLAFVLLGHFFNGSGLREELIWSHNSYHSSVRLQE
jgi:hypothetical protein